MPKVSILIPCYNAERWVGQAIESALAQTWPNKEVIVVDDGSTDGSRAVIESFRDKIRYEFGPNRGGNPCRNRLLELSSGEWIQFLDADDYLLPDKVAKQMEKMAEADVIYGPVLLRTEASNHASEMLSIPDSGADLYEQWIRWQACQTGGVLWRREALLQIGGWNESFVCCQDNEICLRAIKARFKFAYCPEPGAVYRIWSEGTVCRKNPWQLIQTKTRLIDEMLEWLKITSGLEDKHLAAAGQMTFEMARTTAKDSILEAGRYARERKAKGCWHPAGPAAPKNFRVAMGILGFVGAELLAKWARVFARKQI
jgi:glycosyltransferase involved in cell wall biosynthesis